MEKKDYPEIDAKVKKTLEQTEFAASDLERLSGGFVNWVYRAKLSKALEDGTTEVLVKHGELFMSARPEFELNLQRCRIEGDFLKSLSNNPFVGKSDPTDSYSFTVRTAKLYHWDEETTSQIQEYMPNGVDLKNYIIQQYPAPTPDSLKSQCLQLGKALGRWLKDFSEWSAQQPSLKLTAAENKFAQQIKQMLTFSWLPDRVKQYPSVLEESQDILEKVERMAAAEQQDESKLQIQHGDIAPGNVLLPNEPIQEGVDVPVFLIDWECAQLGVPSIDIGQMMAELYALWLYKSIGAARWMMEGVLDAYGDIDEEFAFRTAIQVGSHLICITPTFPDWGTPEQIEGVVRVGRDIIVHAWKKDRPWFEKGDLACLFGGVV